MSIQSIAPTFPRQEKNRSAASAAKVTFESYLKLVLGLELVLHEVKLAFSRREHRYLRIRTNICTVGKSAPWVITRFGFAQIPKSEPRKYLNFLSFELDD